MVRETVVINNASGLHARPASNFVATAKKYESKFTVRKGDMEFNGKSIVKVLTAGIVAGTEVELEFDGPDEEAAMAEMLAAIEAGLGE